MYLLILYQVEQTEKVELQYLFRICSTAFQISSSITVPILDIYFYSVEL